MAAGVSGRTILLVVVALGAGVAFGPQVIEHLPAPVGHWLTRVGGSEDVVATVLTSVHKMNDLNVFGAQLFSVVKTPHAGLIGALDTTTYVIVPGSVRYAVNLSGLGRDSFNWDTKTATLIVVAPDPVPTAANIDGARARVLVDGVDLSTGDEREHILQKSLDVARADIDAKAREDFFMTAARDAGRAALTANFAAPLIAAGFKPTVTVRFRSEALLKG
jgi:hypothetical protein